MLKNHSVHIIATYALLILASPLILAYGVNAQAVNCPAGYVCTPAQQVVNCPTGYVCTPSTPSTSAFYPSSNPFNSSGTVNNTYSNGYRYNNGYTTPTVTNTVVPTTAVTNTTTAASSNSCYFFGTDLTIGSRGADVAALQNLLISKGYNITNVANGWTTAGYFGSQTAAALKQYQAVLGLPSDGYFGATTRAKLNMSCGNSGTVSNPIQLSLSAVFQGQNTSGPVYAFIASSNDSSVASINVTLSCPSGVGAVMKATGDCNDSGVTVQGKSVNWQGLLLNSTGNTQTVTIYAKAYSSNGSLVATSQTSVTVPSQGSTQTVTSSAQPSIYSISPNSGSAQTAVTISGNNLSTASSIEFFNSNGQFVGSLVPSAIYAQSVTFTVSGTFAANMPAGAYQVGVVTSNCAGGCDSNRLSFALTSPATSVTNVPAALSVSCQANPAIASLPALAWYAFVTGGTGPYQYSWSAYNDISAYSSGSTGSQTFTANYSSAGVKSAVIRITDTNGLSGTATCTGVTSAQAQAQAASAQPTLSATCYGSAVDMGKPNGIIGTWNAYPSGGTGSYSYQWSLYQDGVSSQTTSKTASVGYATAGLKQAVARVSDTSGASVNASCSLSAVFTAAAVAQPATVTPAASISTPILSTTSWYADDPSTWPTVSEAASLSSTQAMRVKGATGDQYFAQQNGVRSGKLTSTPPAGTTQIETYVYDYGTGTKIANQSVNVSVTNKPVTSQPLSVSCSGIESGRSVAWSASPSGGRSPYRYSWSLYNDVMGNLNGSTVLQSVTTNYSYAGTKQAVIVATDAAGATASGNCSASIPAQTP